MNFLRLHPDTERWFEQRKQCLECANAHITMQQMGNIVMRCKLAKAEREIDEPSATSSAKRQRKRTASKPASLEREIAYCIDARLPGQPCGPDAALFKEIK